MLVLYKEHNNNLSKEIQEKLFVHRLKCSEGFNSWNENTLANKNAFLSLYESVEEHYFGKSKVKCSPLSQLQGSALTQHERDLMCYESSEMPSSDISEDTCTPRYEGNEVPSPVTSNVK